MIFTKTAKKHLERQKEKSCRLMKINDQIRKYRLVNSLSRLIGEINGKESAVFLEFVFVSTYIQIA